MDAKVIWQNGLSFRGTAESGYELPLDGKIEDGGLGQGFRPMELFAIGMAGCTAMDVISILTKKRQDVRKFDVKVHAEREEDHPKVFTNAFIEYHVTGHDIDEASVLRAIELSATRYCPAQAMFGKLFPISLSYHIYEGDEESERRLVKSGVFDLPLTEAL